jgi:hypothetical protein
MRWSLPLLCLVLSAAQTACAETDAQNDVVFPTRGPVAPPAAVAPGLTTGCEGVAVPTGRLLGRVYPIPLETRRLPDFNALSPAGTICLDRLDISERRGQPGFPGLMNRTEWFAVDLRGAFVVEQPGMYTFRLTSDDGSQLYIDGAIVIDNDGYHQTHIKEGAMHLDAGPHAIGVPYWQGPGPLALVLEVGQPGAGYQVLRMDHALAGGAG